jgi:nucleoside-triphosphatase
MSNIVLTGAPRIGKTTIIRTVIKDIKRGCAGFYTEEMRKSNQRVGFRLITLDNKDCILSHKNIKSRHRVGKYGVNLECIGRVGVASILEGIQAKKVVIIDEIGKMELFSKDFRDVVMKALDSGSHVLGTILFRPHPFCDTIKKRGDVEIIEVTEENRNSLSAIIIDKISREHSG